MPAQTALSLEGEGWGEGELAHTDPFNNHPLHVIQRTLEKRLVLERFTGHRFNLGRKISVMLGGGPNHKDQMMRIDRGQLSAGDPSGDNGRFIVHQLL